jgi:pyruvate formate-lyase activating enzyme-like uncharacterized protein
VPCRWSGFAVCKDIIESKNKDAVIIDERIFRGKANGLTFYYTILREGVLRVGFFETITLYLIINHCQTEEHPQGELSRPSHARQRLTCQILKG